MKLKTLFLADTLLSTIGHNAIAETLKVASATANLPFEFQDASGKTIGFEVDLINIIAERLGMNIEMSLMPHNAIFTAVQSGRADLAIGSATITQKRLETLDFAQPFIDSKQCLTVKSDSQINNLKEMKGKAVGVLTGATGDIWTTNNIKEYGFSEIRRYDTTTEPFLDIPSGRIGGVIHDCPVAYYFIKGKPQYKVVDDIDTKEQYSVFVKKGNPIRDPINAEITKLKQEGKMQEIYKKWFGEEPNENSSTVQVTEIPQAK